MDQSSVLILVRSALKILTKRGGEGKKKVIIKHNANTLNVFSVNLHIHGGYYYPHFIDEDTED